MEPVYSLPPAMLSMQSYDPSCIPELYHAARKKLDATALEHKFARGLKVAVIDSGIEVDHPEFEGRILDAVDMTESKIGPADAIGHGTHVTGIIVGNTVGLARSAKVLAIKIIDDQNVGRHDAVCRAFQLAIDREVDMVNVSLGSPQNSPRLMELTQACRNKGILIVAASGNDANTRLLYPAALDTTLAVGAIDRQDQWMSFSNYDENDMAVDLVDYGDNVISSYLKGTYHGMTGTCIARGSYVYGPNGPKKIEEIKPGDRVYAWKDGQIVTRVVEQTHYRGKAATYILNAGGRDVRLTPTHQILCFDSKTRDYAWVEAQHIGRQHRAMIPRRFDNDVNPYLDSMLSVDFCWLLGFFAGDGWISYCTRGMRTNFASGNKPEVIGRVAEIYHQITGKQLSESKAGGWHYDDSTRLAMIIDCLGMNNPAQSKNVPLWLWNLPAVKQRSFYAGYLAADAHRRKRADGQVGMDCVSQDLVRRMTVLFDYWGVKHGRCRERNRLIKAPNSAKAEWHQSFVMAANPESLISDGWSFLTNNGKDGRCRATDMGIDISQFSTAKIDIIEDFKEVDVYDLTVPDADCFVTQGVITHNSMAAPQVTACVMLRMAAEYARGVKKRWDLRAKYSMLEKACKPVSNMIGRTTKCGWGQLDVTKLFGGERLPDDFMPLATSTSAMAEEEEDILTVRRRVIDNVFIVRARGVELFKVRGTEVENKTC